MQRRIFSTNSLMGKQQTKKVNQLLQNLLDSSDSYEFRNPVDWKIYGLNDYPIIVKKPMDLNTVKKNLNANQYQSVQSCLSDIQLIWDNCKAYNSKDTWIYKMVEKIEKMFRKMVKNYVPFVVFEGHQKIKIKKDISTTKKVGMKIPQPESKSISEQKQKNQLIISQINVSEETEFIRKRRNFLIYIPLCSGQQIGVLFLLIHRNCSEALIYNKKGDININVELIDDHLLERLKDQLDMWGVTFSAIKKK